MKKLRQRIKALLDSPDYRPLNKSEFSRALGIHPNERAALRSELLRLESTGTIVRGKKGRFSLRTQSSRDGSGKNALLIGTLRFHSNGNAWFYPDATDTTNAAAGMDLQKYSRIFISSQKTSTAMHGDTVAVRVDRIGPPEWTKHRRGKKHRDAGMAKPEDEAAGYVEKIIQRGMARIIGTYFKRGKFAHVQPDDLRIPDITVEEVSHSKSSSKPKSGQVVAVELTQWDNPNTRPRGHVTETLGWPDTPGIDMLAIVHKHGLRDEFPDDVLKQALAYGDHVTEADIQNRDDWRDLPVITIDPHDAKDFDDAISVQKTKDGGWQLAVHIADVSHYVKPGTALDKEARERGNSTYMADRVLPMIPHELSNHLCSLMPNVDRLTQCCLMKIDPQGKIKSARFTRAVIHSARRYTYEQAQDIIMSPVEKVSNLFPDEDPHILTMLHEAWHLASILRKRRFNNGALDLDMPEVRVLLNDQGKPTGIEKTEHNESHQLIEEFMLVANETSARLLKTRRQSAIYRIHEDPDPDKLNEYAETAQLHGYQPGDLTNKKNIQKLLDEAKGTIEEPAIKIGLLKSLKRAAYSPEPLGHYGLAKTDYCHFTSPIRRYADLIVHRALQPHLGNPPQKTDHTPSSGEATQIAQHISETERTSAEAENESRRLKMLQYLHMCTQMEDPPTFNCVVTEVRHFGLFVEATDIMSKGLIKAEDFPGRDTQWSYQPDLNRFTGPKGVEYTLGQQHPCQVAHVDMERQMIDFKFLTESTDH